MTIRKFYTDLDIEGNVNILSGKTYQINNAPIISNTITSGVLVSAPSENTVYNGLLVKQSLNTGYISGLILSINADNTKYNISSGYYIVTDNTNPINPTTVLKTFNGISGVTPTYLATSNITYIALDINGNIVTSLSPFTDSQRRSLVTVGGAVHSNRIYINVVNEIKAPIVGDVNQLHDLIKAIGSLNLNGNVYSPNGNNLYLDKSAGTIFGLGINASNSNDPHKLSISGQTQVSFRYRLRGGTEYSDTTSIDPSQYDLNGVLTPVNNNKFTIQHINLFQSGISRLQYGQVEYASIDDAILNLSSEPFITEQNIAENAIFRCYLIIKQGVTDLTAAIAASNAKFIAVDKFGNVIGSAGFSLTQANIIAALGYTPENIGNKVTSISSGSTNTQYPSAKLFYDQLNLKLSQSVIEDTKAITGFIDGNNINVSYNQTGRTITLTGNLAYMWRGQIKTLGSPWTSSGHTATTGSWYLLSNDGVNFIWSTTPWNFEDMMVAFVHYDPNPNLSYAIRETHGTMDYKSHEEFHTQIGTYRTSGGIVTSGTYLENTATDAANSMGFDAAVIKDEDLTTTIPAWVEGIYTTMYVSGNSSIFNTTSTLPFIATTNTFIQVNDPTTGSMIAGINGRWYNVYQIIMPCASDIDSQKYRMIMLQPQTTHTSLASAQAEDTRILNLGGLYNISPEFIIYSRITYVTSNSDNNIGKCRIATGGISYVGGNKSSQINVIGFTTNNHQSLSNLTWNNSGHLGVSDNLAAFNSSGVAEMLPKTTYSLSGHTHNNYLNITDFNTYSGNTNTLINTKLNIVDNTQLNLLSQGLAWNSSADTYTRLGSISTIATSISAGDQNLPIHSQMRRCLINNDESINYYISNNNPLMKDNNDIITISGITTAILSYHLVNTNTDFVSTGVKTGNYVINTTTNAYAMVTNVTTTDLTLNLDIMSSGDTYYIGNVRYDGSDGQVMTQIPKFYYKQILSGTTKYWYVSLYKLNGFELHPAFIRDGKEVPYRYMGSFEGSMYDASSSRMTSQANIPNQIYASGDMLCSIAGQWAKTSESRNNFRLMANQRGTNWRQMDYLLLSAIQLLYLIEYANFNSQSMIGAGRANLSGGGWTPNSYIGMTGFSVKNGNNTASVQVGGTNGFMTDYMSYRGIENFYGNVWKFIDGITWDSTLNDATSPIPIYVSNNKTYYNNNNRNGMTLLCNATNIGNTNEGYSSNIENCIGFIPSSVGAGSTTKITDYYWQYSTNGGGWRVPLFGSRSDNGGMAGVFALYSNDGWSTVWVTISARLCL